PQVCGPAVVYDRDVELKWSSVRAIPAGLRERMKRYTLRFTRLTTADQAIDELRKGRPLTWAGTWGGQIPAIRKGTQFPVLVMPHRGVWSHQQSCLGYWEHPELGELFYILNQWYQPGPGMKVEYVNTPDGTVIGRIVTPGTARSVHGEPLQGEPPGGYWVTREDMEYQCKYGEVCSLHGLRGYDGGLVSI
ncbi:MAG: hypothetical protein K2V38_05385, partial [Gemmataceae bacterium]|nr:hypothetical protein [Gemmataceae bacterium]